MKIKLRKYREERGLTQQEIAKAIGKSFRTIQSWERDESYPNAEYVWKLCEFFGTDPNDFLGWYDEHPADASSPPSDPMERELSELFKECTVQRKRRLVEYARDAAAMSKDAAERDSGVAGVMEAV